MLKFLKGKSVSALCVFGFSLCALSIPVIAFWQVIERTSGIAHTLPIPNDNTAWDPQSGRGVAPNWYGQANPQALVTIGSFDSSQKRLSVNVWIDLSPLLDDGSIQDWDGHSFDDSSITPWLSKSASVFIGGTIVRRVPLGSLLSGITDYATPESFDVQVNRASSERYPGDWYVAPLDILVLLPPGLIDARNYNFHSAWAMGWRARVLPDTALSTEASMSQYRVGYSKDGTTGRLNVVITRSSHQEIFIWVVALVPVLLLAVAVIGRRPESSAISIEFAAAMLAILPLRLVLVPTALDQITALDYLLGAELVLTTAVVSFFLISSSGKGKRPSDSGPATAHLDRDNGGSGGESRETRQIPVTSARGPASSVDQRPSPIVHPARRAVGVPISVAAVLGVLVLSHCQQCVDGCEVPGLAKPEFLDYFERRTEYVIAYRPSPLM